MIPLLFLAAFSGAEAQQNHGPTVETSGPDFRQEVEKQAFILINQYRKTNELSPLEWNEDIAKIARSHSKDMASGEVDFGHGGFGDRISRLKALISGFEGAGENVFMSDNPDQVAQKAVAVWLHSPHHLKNIRGDYNYSGMGVSQDKNGVIYFTQIFLKIQSPTEEAQAQPPPSGLTTFGILANPETRPAR